MRIALAALALLAATPVAAQEVIDEPQWIYRDIEGTEGAAAIFLAWDYRSVVIRAICERDEEGAGTLLLEYFPTVDSVADDPPLALIVEGRARPMQTTLTTAGGLLAMQGRLVATPELADWLEGADHIQLDAPNEMEEPWHLDRAEPLRRLARSCASAGI